MIADVFVSAVTEHALLAPTVHAVKSGDDLILLDLETDDYILIPECPTVQVIGADLRAPMDLLLDLAANELLQSDGPASDRPEPPPLPRHALYQTGSQHPTLGDVASFASIWIGAATRKPALRTLAKRFAEREGCRDDLPAVAARVETFRQLLPFAPSVGACLFQTELLLRFLNAANLDADWVFGVRTWPFMAHCWLQIGDHCVSQNPETLTMYRPIIVI